MQSYKFNIFNFRSFPIILFFVYFVSIPISGQSTSTIIDSLKTLIEKQPENWIPNNNLGRYYFMKMQYADAIKYYERALALKPGQMTIMSSLAYCYGYCSRFEDMYTISNYYNLFSDSTNYVTLYEAGMAASYLGKYDEAIILLKKSIAKSLSENFNNNLELDIAIIYTKINDTIQANKFLANYLNYQPIRGNSRYRNLANYYLGDYHKAMAGIEATIETTKTIGLDLYNWGNFMIAAGDSNGLIKIKMAKETDTSVFLTTMYDAIRDVQLDSLVQARSTLTQNFMRGESSGLRKGLLAWINEKLSNQEEANKYWFECWGKVPLGIDVESMRNYIERYIKTIKGQK